MPGRHSAVGSAAQAARAPGGAASAAVAGALRTRRLGLSGHASDGVQSFHEGRGADSRADGRQPEVDCEAATWRGLDEYARDAGARRAHVPRTLRREQDTYRVTLLFRASKAKEAVSHVRYSLFLIAP